MPVSSLLNNKENHFPSLKEFIENRSLTQLEDRLKETVANKTVRYLTETALKYAPIHHRPEKILCVGLNYADLAEETGATELPKEPVLFSKFNNSLAAHQDKIPFQRNGRKLDYEAELVIVIGKEARNIKGTET